MEDPTYQQLKKSRFYHPEVTEVIYDIHQLEGMIAGAINVVEKGFDMVWDKMMFNFHFNHLHEGYEMMERLIDEKNLKIRLIVEAIPENIDQINSIKNYEIRHLDDIRSNFGILDNRAYVVSIFHKGSEKPQQAFFSNSRFFIDKQQTLFDQLWGIAIPLHLRNKGLHLKQSCDTFKSLNKIDEIQITINTLMENSKKELIVFTSMNMLVNLSYLVPFWQKCIRLESRNIRIKILTDGSTSEIRNQINKIKETSGSDRIQIEYTSKLGSINECIIISDGKSLIKLYNDYLKSESLTALLTYDLNLVLVQEILFEKYRNEIDNLTLVNQQH
jgi:hypothetical protein